MTLRSRPTTRAIVAVVSLLTWIAAGTLLLFLYVDSAYIGSIWAFVCTAPILPLCIATGCLPRACMLDSIRLSAASAVPAVVASFNFCKAPMLSALVSGAAFGYCYLSSSVLRTLWTKGEINAIILVVAGLVVLAEGDRVHIGNNTLDFERAIAFGAVTTLLPQAAMSIRPRLRQWHTSL